MSWFIFLYSLVIGLISAKACPEKCKCSELTVDCRMQGLTDFPKLNQIPHSSKVINLANNQLTFLELSPPDRVLQHVTILDLSNNKLHRLPLLPMKSIFPSLTNLDLRYNDINESSSLDHDTLTFLDLGRNKLFALSKDTFSKVDSLKILILDHNMIGYIHQDAFKKLKYLVKISLGHNNLNYVDMLWFNESKIIETIYLNNNKITSTMSPDTNMDWPQSLEELDLSNNKLKLIPPLLNPGNKNYMMDLRYNPINCGCKLKVYGSEYVKEKVACGLKVTCSSPPNMAALGVAQNRSKCSQNSITFVASFLSRNICIKPSITRLVYEETLGNVSCAARGNPDPFVVIKQETGLKSHGGIRFVSVKFLGGKLEDVTCSASNALGSVSSNFFKADDRKSTVTTKDTDITNDILNFATHNSGSDTNVDGNKEKGLLVGIISVSTIMGVVATTLGTYGIYRLIKYQRRKKQISSRPLPLIPPQAIDDMARPPSSTYETMESSPNTVHNKTIVTAIFVKENVHQVAGSDADVEKTEISKYEEPLQHCKETTL